MVLRFLKEARDRRPWGSPRRRSFAGGTGRAIGPEIFDALGVMSDWLARRASAGRSGKPGEATAAHLEVVAAYGVTMTTFERDTAVQLCANGDPQRRVLALPSTDIQKAIAALALTRHECVSPALTPVERYAPRPMADGSAGSSGTRQTARSAEEPHSPAQRGVWASLAYQRARRPELGMQAVQEAANRAIDHLAAINNKTELMETDAAAYSDAAIRSRSVALVGGTRNAGLDGQGRQADRRHQPRPARGDLRGPRGCQARCRQSLASRCTYGIVWPASAAANADGGALALAVQTGDTWREMWVFRRRRMVGRSVSFRPG